jgi:hypothetical protein
MAGAQSPAKAITDKQEAVTAPQQAAPSLDELRVMVREEVQLALQTFTETLVDQLMFRAEALEVLEAQSIDQPAPELQARTILHGMFTYDLPGGGQAIARRGDTVGLLPHDVERGERFHAFTAKPGQLPEPAGSILPAFPIEGSEAEQDGWVGSGSVQEIITAVNARPEILTAVIAAEQRRGDAARTTLLAALAKLHIAA